ncbi:hypothetical protein LINGRAHAP2_LOCUS26199 [Linum grandiflorum]
MDSRIVSLHVAVATRRDRQKRVDTTEPSMELLSYGSGGRISCFSTELTRMESQSDGRSLCKKWSLQNQKLKKEQR